MIIQIIIQDQESREKHNKGFLLQERESSMTQEEKNEKEREWKNKQNKSSKKKNIIYFSLVYFLFCPFSLVYFFSF